MSDEKLGQVKIKQTMPIRFKDEAINKIKKQNIDFGKRFYVFFSFIVSKDSHQKGLKRHVYKGTLRDKETKKVFYIQYCLMVELKNIDLEIIHRNMVLKNVMRI